MPYLVALGTEEEAGRAKRAGYSVDTNPPGKFQLLSGEEEAAEADLVEIIVWLDGDLMDHLVEEAV